MINWKNLDTLNSYGNLSEVDKVRLSEVMSADRVKSYSTPTFSSSDSSFMKYPEVSLYNLSFFYILF